MMSENLGATRNKFFGPFLWIVIGTGSLAFLYSVAHLDFAHFDSRFAVLVAMALLLTSQFTVPIPRFSRKPRIVAFNWACAAVSILITSSLLRLAFGDVVALRANPFTGRFIAAI